MPKEKYEKPGRQHSLMSAADVASGKQSTWYSIEITGSVRNICPQLFHFQHITSLFLNGNHLVQIPPEVCHLIHLNCLDLSFNKLRSIPAELGDLSELRELLLNSNQLRTLPYELGKLFQLEILDLGGNPLPTDYLNTSHSGNGAQKLVHLLLDHLPGLQWLLCLVEDVNRVASLVWRNYVQHYILCIELYSYGFHLSSLQN